MGAVTTLSTRERLQRDRQMRMNQMFSPEVDEYCLAKGKFVFKDATAYKCLRLCSECKSEWFLESLGLTVYIVIVYRMRVMNCCLSACDEV